MIMLVSCDVYLMNLSAREDDYVVSYNRRVCMIKWISDPVDDISIMHVLTGIVLTHCQ